MQVRLKVIKTDVSIEEYLHTKIIGTLANALAAANQADTSVAEELAEAVTYFIYRSRKRRSITSGEIFSIVKASLASTGYHEAAIALSEHHYLRRLKRSRIEVIPVDIRHLADAELLCGVKCQDSTSRWDKSVIVDGLVTEYAICRQTARMIASMVEDKILRIGITQVPTSLIRQLVLGDTAAALQAHSQLQTV